MIMLLDTEKGFIPIYVTIVDGGDELISKRIFLHTIKCPRLGWSLHHSKTREELSQVAIFRIKQGNFIEQEARKLFPEGVLIREIDPKEASLETTRQMNDPSVTVIFQATFITGNFVTKADVIIREDKSWNMVEFKSGLNKKQDHIDDMAYTTMIMQQSGTSLGSISLVLLSRDFRLGSGHTQMFNVLDCTDEVTAQARHFLSAIDNVDKILLQVTIPDSELQLICKKCELFRSCEGENVDNHILDLPNFRRKRFLGLVELGINRIEDIPLDYQLTSNQARVRDAVQTSHSFIASTLDELLTSIETPIHYLDFETVSPAIPLFPEIRPYQTIPFQYSIHICSSPGVVSGHFEYLADHSKDSRKDLLQSLISHLGKDGSILVYTVFEKAVMNRLKETYPEYTVEIDSIIDRFVDLNKIIKNHYYHRDFHGSTSIKVVLPVLAPTLSYDNLEINEGQTAMITFEKMITGEIPSGLLEETKRQLLEYCKMDTYAMVNVHEKLVEQVSQRL